MPLTIIFVISGLAIIALVTIKRLEVLENRSFSALRLISKSDIYVRETSHKLILSYDNYKERGQFLIKKQAPLRIKSFKLKLITAWDEVSKRHLHKLRDTKIIRARKEGISEFFGKLREEEENNSTVEQEH